MNAPSHPDAGAQECKQEEAEQGGADRRKGGGKRYQERGGLRRAADGCVNGEGEGQAGRAADDANGARYHGEAASYAPVATRQGADDDIHIGDLEQS